MISAPAPIGADLRPDLAPFDRVKFWSVIRFRPDGPVVEPADGIGELGAHRVVNKRGWGHCLRVKHGGRIEYVPIDAARYYDPNQLSFGVA